VYVQCIQKLDIVSTAWHQRVLGFSLHKDSLILLGISDWCSTVNGAIYNTIVFNDTHVARQFMNCSIFWHIWLSLRIVLKQQQPHFIQYIRQEKCISIRIGSRNFRSSSK